ncbi:chromatin accessibility complex protein 1-like [Amphiura filiformis]|uniref:chromatin accessibility complex protein 1-like n=1 Tax=Amphiura filiformis TaxID=82378 RepID=UPI003B21ED01
MGDSKTAKMTLLPIARIRTIMKSSPEIASINQESLFLITKATELFVQCIAQTAYDRTTNQKNLVYNDLAEIVDTDESFQFLADVVPKKVLVRDYLNSLQQQSVDSSSEEDA